MDFSSRVTRQWHKEQLIKFWGDSHHHLGPELFWRVPCGGNELPCFSSWDQDQCWKVFHWGEMCGKSGMYNHDLIFLKSVVPCHVHFLFFCSYVGYWSHTGNICLFSIEMLHCVHQSLTAFVCVLFGAQQVVCRRFISFVYLFIAENSSLLWLKMRLWQQLEWIKTVKFTVVMNNEWAERHYKSL